MPFKDLQTNARNLDMVRESMMGAERRHRWLMGVYVFGAVLALVTAQFPSFMCRAGSAVLLSGLAHMTWQRRCALREGHEEQRRLRKSVLYYAPFLVGTNLIWMGLPLPVDAVLKASADCGFLAATVVLLGGLYLYNNRDSNALSDLSILGTNPHSEEG